MSSRRVQGKRWSIAPNHWSRYFEPWFLPMYKTTLDELQLNGNHTVLDAGCGSGLFSWMAIRTGADVSGVDAAPGLLDIARERNPHNHFMEEDLEELPFADETFHVVTGFNSFQYAGSIGNALAESKRILKPGGRLVIGAWARPALSQAAEILKAIAALLPPPPAGTPGPFALSEEGKIEALLEKQELKLIFKTMVSCPFLYTSSEEGVKSFMGTGDAAAAAAHTDQQTVETAIARALYPFSLPEGIHFLQNRFMVFIAEK